LTKIAREIRELLNRKVELRDDTRDRAPQQREDDLSQPDLSEEVIGEFIRQDERIPFSFQSFQSALETLPKSETKPFSTGAGPEVPEAEEISKKALLSLERQKEATHLRIDLSGQDLRGQ